MGCDMGACGHYQGVQEPHYGSEGEQSYQKASEEEGGNYPQGVKEPHYRQEGEQSYKESAEEKGGNTHQGVKEPNYRPEGVSRTRNQKRNRVKIINKVRKS